MNRILTASQLSLAALASATALNFFAGASLAQSISPAESFNQPDAEQGGDYRSSPLGGSFNPIDMMHNANLSRSRTGGEFAEDTQRNLKNAASEFKRLQLQRMQEQQAAPLPEAAGGIPAP